MQLNFCNSQATLRMGGWMPKAASGRSSPSLVIKSDSTIVRKYAWDLHSLLLFTCSYRVYVHATCIEFAIKLIPTIKKLISERSIKNSGFSEETPESVLTRFGTLLKAANSGGAPPNTGPRVRKQSTTTNICPRSKEEILSALHGRRI